MVEVMYLGSYNVFTCNTLIFTCLGDQEWMDSEGYCWMTFPIGKILPWAKFFIEKKVYCNRYSIYTYNLSFFKCLGTQEWVDGIE